MAELTREEISSQGYQVVREWDVAGTAGTQRFASVLPPGAHVGQEKVIVIKSPQAAEVGTVVSGYISPAEGRKPPPELKFLKQREQVAMEREESKWERGGIEYREVFATPPPEERRPVEKTVITERPGPVEVIPPPSPWKIIPFAFKAPFVAAERAAKKYVPLGKITRKLPPTEKVFTPKVEAYFKKAYVPIAKAELKLKPWKAFYTPVPEKLAERALGIPKGAYRLVREEPWTVLGYAAAGAAIPPAFAGLKYAGVPAGVTKVAGIGIGATWIGGKVAQIATAPTETARGEIIGRGLVEFGALVLGAKYIGAPLAARVESKAIIKAQVKKLSPAQQTKFKKFLEETKKLETTGHPPVKEVSLKGTERIPSRARGTIKSFIRQKKDLLGGSMAQRTQLHGKATVGRSYAESDVDLYTKGSPIKRATGLVKALKARGIKRVSQVPGTGRVTIAGKKAVEYHTMEKYAQNIYQAEGFFKPVKETITTDPTGIKVQTIKSQAKRKLIGAYLQGRYEKDYPDFKRSITSIRQATAAEAKKALFKKPREKIVAKEKRIEAILPGKKLAPKMKPWRVKAFEQITGRKLTKAEHLKIFTKERAMPKAIKKPKAKEELIPVLFPKKAKPGVRFAKIVEKPYPRIPKTDLPYPVSIKPKAAPYVSEKIELPAAYPPTKVKKLAAPYAPPIGVPLISPPYIPTKKVPKISPPYVPPKKPPKVTPPYIPPKAPPKVAPYAPPRVSPYAPPVSSPYVPPSRPLYTPPPVRPSMYVLGLGFRMGRTKPLPSAKRKFRYTPTLVGIATKKVITKAPKVRFTGIETRYPIKRKKRKRWFLGGLKL